MRRLWPALAASISALALVPATANATFPGNPGRIAYSGSTETDPGSLYTIKPDGSGNRLVVRGATQPSWSGDGKRLAFVYDRGIWQSRADGSHLRNIVPAAFRGGEVLKPVWSPNGRRVAFTWEHETDEELWVSATFVINRDGKHIRKISNHSGDISWAPDGRHIAFLGDQHDIWWMRPDGSHKHVLKHTRAQFHAYNIGLDFSPSGHRLIYSHAPSAGPSTIEVLHLRTRKVHHIAKSHAAWLGWRPSGGRLAFLDRASEPHGDELHLIKPNGTGEQTLFGFPPDILVDSFSWQPRPRR